MSKTWRRPRKLLVATDLTPRSGLAVDRGLQLAARWGAQLYLVHVIEVVGATSAAAVATASKLVAEVEAEIKRQITRNAVASGIDQEVLTPLGNPEERILAKCDRLLMIFSTGRRLKNVPIGQGVIP